MAQAFKEPIEARSILHNVLGKIVRSLRCTTIFIVEVPLGAEKIGISIEEFVADGVIILKREYHDDRLIREIEIKKLRGTRFERQKFLFTLHKGFRVFPPFYVKEMESPQPFKQLGALKLTNLVESQNLTKYWVEKVTQEALRFYTN